MADPELQKLRDESDIRNLISRLAIMADHAENLEDYLDLWTEDGTYDVLEPVGWQPGDESMAKVARGRDGLRKDREFLRAVGFQGPGTDLWHANTTLGVTVHDDGTAEAESYWLLIHGKGTVNVIRVGHYHDTFRKTGECWKIAYRRVLPNNGGPSPEAMAEG